MSAIDNLPPSLLVEYNKLYPVDADLLEREFKQTNVQLVVHFDTRSVHYGIRQVDDTAVILVKNAEVPHFIILPECNA